MAKVLPSINCHFRDNEAVAARVRQIEDLFQKVEAPSGQMAHFDIADGTMTFNKSWDEPERLASIKPKFPFEAHLMVEDPRPAAERWLAAGASRVIVHLKAASLEEFAAIVEMAKRYGAEAVLALDPETPAGDAVPYFDVTSNFLIMSVYPGLSGQKFLPLVLEKAAFLREKMPDAKIEFDGGIDLAAAQAALAAGGDSFVSDSYIFRNDDPAAAYRELAGL